MTSRQSKPLSNRMLGSFFHGFFLPLYIHSFVVPSFHIVFSAYMYPYFSLYSLTLWMSNHVPITLSAFGLVNTEYRIYILMQLKWKDISHFQTTYYTLESWISKLEWMNRNAISSSYYMADKTDFHCVDDNFSFHFVFRRLHPFLRKIQKRILFGDKVRHAFEL